MNLTTFVDVAIGLSIVYLGASLFVTILNEYIAHLLELRAKQLTRDLKELIGDPAKQIAGLTDNPALAKFFGGRGGSYVDPNVLAQHLVGGLMASTAGIATMNDVLAEIKNMPASTLKNQLLALAQSGARTVDNFVQSVSVWVDRSLTMMGESYKKRSQIISFFVGLAIAVLFNLDTVGIADRLYRDKEARDAIVVVGSDLVQATSGETLKQCSKLTLEELRADPSCAGVRELLEGLQLRNETFGQLPIGWTNIPNAPWSWATAAVGWLFTALAISLGASFWFDLLNRLVNMRNGMRRPEVANKATDAASPPKPPVT